MNLKRSILNEVWKNTILMLRDRGYKLTKESVQPNWNPLSDTEDGTALAKKKISCVSPKYQKIFLYMADQKLGIKEIRTILLCVTKNSTNHVILILKHKLTPQAQLLLMDHPNLKFEIFTFEEMSFNPTMHVLVPKFKILSKPKKKELETNISEKIPSIRADDRIVRHYGAEIGDILQITRPNEIIFKKVIE